MRVLWTPAAKAELFEAADFYDANKSGPGGEFLDNVERALSFIRQYPNAAPLQHAATRQQRTERFPYGLVYLVRAADIVIIAVVHLKRQPGYWHGRVKETD